MLVVPPEGTRSHTKNWKSGFYHIAHGANVPVLPTFLDYGKKNGGFGTPIRLSGNITEDMDIIRTFYEPYCGKYPELSGPVQLSEEAHWDALKLNKYSNKTTSDTGTLWKFSGRHSHITNFTNRTLQNCLAACARSMWEAVIEHYGLTQGIQRFGLYKDLTLTKYRVNS